MSSLWRSVVMTTLMLVASAPQSVCPIRWLSLATLSASERHAGPVRGARHLSSNAVAPGHAAALTNSQCRRLTGLTRRQRRVCRRNAENMVGVRDGAHLAIDECQHQFRHRRWNCSVVDRINVFGKVVTAGTREAAFVHAVSSSAVVYAVTRACSSGQLDRCGCDRSVTTRSPPPSAKQRRRARSGWSRKTATTDDLDDGGGSFRWSGCSDNIAYGVAFAKSFVDAGERTGRNRSRRSDRAVVNLHNNNAGRKAVADNVRLRCKCHGVSGSCEVRTCWRTVPSMRHVGTLLLNKYDVATQVSLVREGGSRTRLERSPGFLLLHRTRVQTPVAASGRPGPSELVYVEASPDFCDADERTGAPGTAGRRCGRATDGADRCEVMCCGRGHATRSRTVVEKCRCRFHWCCAVRCERCREQVVENVCR